MLKQPIDLQGKLTLFSDLWSPKVIAEMNDYQFKLVKIQGDFVWHDHPETDEVFIVLKGRMAIAFEEAEVNLEAGQMYVVPRGVRHKPYARELCQIMLVEPKGLVNTGTAGGALTAANDVWI
ncbi:MAG: cupin domain-containing protein [Deinococcales bacterium]